MTLKWTFRQHRLKEEWLNIWFSTHSSSANQTDFKSSSGKIPRQVKERFTCSKTYHFFYLLLCLFAMASFQEDYRMLQWLWERWTLMRSTAHPKRFCLWLRTRLWWSIHVQKRDFTHPETLFHILRPMKPAIIISEDVSATRMMVILRSGIFRVSWPHFWSAQCYFTERQQTEARSWYCPRRLGQVTLGTITASLYPSLSLSWAG